MIAVVAVESEHGLTPSVAPSPPDNALRRMSSGQAHVLWLGEISLRIAAPMIGHDITWGHVALWATRELNVALTMMARGLRVLEEPDVESVVVYNAHRCIPLDLHQLTNVGPGFALAPAGSRCAVSTATHAVEECPNSTISLRRHDHAAIGIPRESEIDVRRFMSIALDPRICRSYGDLQSLTSRFLEPKTLSGCVQLADMIDRTATVTEPALVIVPGGLRSDGHFETPCGHPSAVGEWDLERLVDSASIPSRPVRLPTLPGGLVIDDAIRLSVREAICDYLDGVGPRPPDPWSDGPAAFYRWLESPKDMWRPGSGRYWDATWSSRPDVAAAFPEPDGRSTHEFRKWCEQRFATEGASPLLSAPSDPRDLVVVPETCETGPGINLIGYLVKELGLGEIARSIAACAERASLPTAELPYWRSPSADIREVLPPFRLPYSRNLAVVTADQVRYLRAETPAELWTGHVNVGYWFWEIEDVPIRMIDAARGFDEIWVATEFVRAALSRVLDIPVRRVPIPIRPVGTDADATRAASGREPRCRFLTTLDLNSVVARKNPRAAVTSFIRAFPTMLSGGPELTIKTMNGHRHRAELHALQRATAGRDDIRVVDQTLTRREQNDLIGSSTCLVSLHRSEGLGLHLAEAMALGVPVIATGYSGNLDFMTSDNALLVEHSLVDIGEAGPYSGLGQWAEPDIDSAADAMRAIEADGSLRERLAINGRASIQSYSDAADAALTAALVGLASAPVGRQEGS